MAIITEADLTKSLNNLAPTFKTAINATIEAESQPLKKAQAAKDQLDIRKGIYSDIKTNLTALQNALQVMISTQASYGLNQVSKPTVTPATIGSTVFTATTSETAVTADYEIAVTQLARAQSRATGSMSSPDLALGKSGIFWLGGSGTASVSNFTPGDALMVVEAATVTEGQRELGQGDYSMQVRDNNGVRQFRLVNADGNAVSIRSKDGTSFTTSWQNMSDGSFDTGRGVTLALNATGSVGSTSFSYTAKGQSISITATDTQRTIASAINGILQPEGHDFRASIVGGKLVLTSNQTGANHAMVYTDGASLGFGADLQSAKNAIFTVNGMEVSRATNTNLTDVVEGSTINLAGDAEGKSARLSIGANSDKALMALGTFVNAYNNANNHLVAKMATTSKTVGTKTTYTRGPLSGDTIFRGLRSEMYALLRNQTSNSGSFKSLEDVGITFDKEMKMAFDTAKFNDAIKSHGSDLTALLDAALGKVNNLLSHHTGTTGMLQQSLTSMDNQLKSYDSRISRYTQAQMNRKQSLIDQYQQMQSQLADLGNQASMFGISLTGSSTNSSINILS